MLSRSGQTPTVPRLPLIMALWDLILGMPQLDAPLPNDEAHSSGVHMARICTRRVLIGDVDSAGIAFTGRLIAIALEIHEEGLRSIGIDFSTMISQGTLGVPIVHLETDFKKPLRHGDTFHGELVCERIGDSSYGLRIDLVLEPTNTIAATIRLVSVCVDRPTMTSVPMTAEMRAQLQRILVPKVGSE